MAARRLVPLAAAITVAAFAPTDARACSIPTCGGSAAAPGDRQYVPLGAPAFAYRPGDAAMQGTSVPDVRLYTAEGQPVEITLSPDPASERYLLVRPKVALESGHYRLVDFGHCLHNSPGPSPAWPAFNHGFWVTNPSALPTSIGEVKVAASQHMSVEIYDSARCSDVAPDAAVALISIDLTDSARAYLPLARLTLHVDGTLWAAS
ncbi:MAG TPA: hypothetical protein VGF45_12820, partial [Polyangia bacterium]